MARILALALTVALAACGEPTPRAPVVGQEARAAVDAATAAYSDCITTSVKRLAVPTIQASDAADAAFKACEPVRAALVAKVFAFRRIGMPAEPLISARSVAEASVSAIETDLRGEAVVTAVSTQVDRGEALTTSEVPPAPDAAQETK